MSTYSAVTENVLARLQGVRRSGDGAMTKCPAHEDERASLSVRDGDEGRVLLFCHAGCETELIVSKLGMTMADLFPRGENSAGKKMKIVATYDYKDSAGVLRYQSLRYEPKGFKQRRPDGCGGWIWALKGITPLPYCLPDLLASDRSSPVLIPEGEKDVEALRSRGFVATTNHGGAEKWRNELSQHLIGRDVVLIPDNDDAGRRHVVKVAASLETIAASVRILELPSLPEKGDVSDWLTHGSIEDLRRLIEGAEDAKVVVERLTTGDTEATAEPASKGATSEAKINLAQRLIGIAETTTLLFHDERQTAHAAIDASGEARRIVPINSGAFSTYLAGSLYTETGRTATGEAIASARRVLTYKAASGPEHPLHNRFAYFDDALWIDLADSRQQAVKVTASGWSVVRPPILFRRFKHQSALPQPATCGDLGRLSAFVTPHTEADALLLPVWTAAAMLGHVPRPILDFYGPQGAAKTTTAKMIRRLTDPSALPTSYLSRRDEELALCLEANAVPLFDNVGQITERQAEILCSAVTGGGFSKRELYSDSEEVLYSFRRAILLTGINVATVAPDLLDRFLLISLDRINRSQRRSEVALWQAFDAAAPTIFAGMLDVLSNAMRLYPAIAARTQPLERMADFCLWGAALAEALGAGALSFAVAYRRNVSAQTEEVLEADPLAQAIRELVAAKGGFSGTPSDLLKALRESDEADRDRWPTQPNRLTRDLRTLQGTLAEVGISVEFRRKNQARTIVLRSASRPQLSSQSSPPSPVQEGRARESDDSDDGDDVCGYSPTADERVNDLLAELSQEQARGVA